MSKSTISTFQLFEMFPTSESARIYLESRLWPDGAFCQGLTRHSQTVPYADQRTAIDRAAGKLMEGSF